MPGEDVLVGPQKNMQFPKHHDKSAGIFLDVQRFYPNIILEWQY